MRTLENIVLALISLFVIVFLCNLLFGCNVGSGRQDIRINVNAKDMLKGIGVGLPPVVVPTVPITQPTTRPAEGGVK